MGDGAGQAEAGPDPAAGAGGGGGRDGGHVGVGHLAEEPGCRPDRAGGAGGVDEGGEEGGAVGRAQDLGEVEFWRKRKLLSSNQWEW